MHPNKIYRPCPWPLRPICWLVIATQTLAPFPPYLRAADAPSSTPTLARQESTPAPEPTPQTVTVNRSVPKVTAPPRSPVFSNPPADQEIFRARVFAEPLVPMGKTTAAENTLLAQALLSFLARTKSDDVAPISEFLEQNPQSAWRASLLTDLGIVYRNSGYFTKALEAWEEAWQLGKAENEPNAYAIATRAVGELIELNARLGRYDRLDQLFLAIQGRNISGPATVKISGARQGLWLMQNQPDKAFRCGPMALDRIRASIRPADAFDDKIRLSQSTTQGMSLVQVRDLASDLKMDYQMARRTPGAKVVVPAVVHWNSGHYAAITKEANDLFLLQDPTFGNDLWVSQTALDTEASGSFLIPKGPLPTGWETLSQEEGRAIWGKGNTLASDPNSTKKTDKQVPDPCEETPMAHYTFHAMLVSLHIVDTPVRYNPPRGYPVQFTVTSNQREANQPSIFPYSNLGPKWTFDWLAYITDDPVNLLANASYYVQGGGTEPYSTFNTNTQSYASQVESRAQLVRTSSTSYERRLPDGSKEVFDLPDGAATYPRKIFLRKRVDPSGNTLTFTYDGSFRIVSVTDAIGQVTTLSYALAGDSLKITKVTDPFGRFATFDYSQISNVWRLVTITDTIGIKSQFTYSGDFITSLTTPYGITSFATGGMGQTNWLQATDPQGLKERLEYDNQLSDILSNDPFTPSGMNICSGQYLDFRNSFFWNKEAMQDFPSNYTKAHIYHWCHGIDANQTSNVLESEKDALESRVWYNYYGQMCPYNEGTNTQPTAIGRLLDDGSTQLYKRDYNDLGKITRTVDPTNRTSFFNYDTNLIDLLNVQQPRSA